MSQALSAIRSYLWEEPKFQPIQDPFHEPDERLNWIVGDPAFHKLAQEISRVHYKHDISIAIRTFSDLGRELLRAQKISEQRRLPCNEVITDTVRGYEKLDKRVRVVTRNFFSQCMKSMEALQNAKNAVDEGQLDIARSLLRGCSTRANELIEVASQLANELEELQDLSDTTYKSQRVDRDRIALKKEGIEDDAAKLRGEIEGNKVQIEQKQPLLVSAKDEKKDAASKSWWYELSSMAISAFKAGISFGGASNTTTTISSPSDSSVLQVNLGKSTKELNRLRIELAEKEAQLEEETKTEESKEDSSDKKSNAINPLTLEIARLKAKIENEKEEKKDRETALGNLEAKLKDNRDRNHLAEISLSGKVSTLEIEIVQHKAEFASSLVRLSHLTTKSDELTFQAKGLDVVTNSNQAAACAARQLEEWLLNIGSHLTVLRSEVIPPIETASTLRTEIFETALNWSVFYAHAKIAADKADLAFQTHNARLLNYSDLQ